MGLIITHECKKKVCTIFYASVQFIWTKAKVSNVAYKVWWGTTDLDTNCLRGQKIAAQKTTL